MAITAQDLMNQSIKVKQLQVVVQQKQKLVVAVQDDVRIAQRAVADAMADYNVMRTQKDFDDATAASVPKS